MVPNALIFWSQQSSGCPTSTNLPEHTYTPLIPGYVSKGVDYINLNQYTISDYAAPHATGKLQNINRNPQSAKRGLQRLRALVLSIIRAIDPRRYVTRPPSYARWNCAIRGRLGDGLGSLRYVCETRQSHGCLCCLVTCVCWFIRQRQIRD